MQRANTGRQARPRLNATLGIHKKTGESVIAMMKYFTLDDWIRDQDLELVDTDHIVRTINAYKCYLESIKPRLPEDIRRLLNEYCIHDGILRDLQIDVQKATVIMSIGAGDITMKEGREISLHYSGVTNMRSTADPKRGFTGTKGYGDLGNDELELLENGLIEHRFLFSSGIQMLIRFRTFRLEEHKRW